MQTTGTSTLQAGEDGNQAIVTSSSANPLPDWPAHVRADLETALVLVGTDGLAAAFDVPCNGAWRTLQNLARLDKELATLAPSQLRRKHDFGGLSARLLAMASRPPPLPANWRQEANPKARAGSDASCPQFGSFLRCPLPSAIWRFESAELADPGLRLLAAALVIANAQQPKAREDRKQMRLLIDAATALRQLLGPTLPALRSQLPTVATSLGNYYASIAELNEVEDKRPPISHIERYLGAVTGARRLERDRLAGSGRGRTSALSSARATTGF